jgi:hypothetical protein
MRETKPFPVEQVEYYWRIFDVAYGDLEAEQARLEHERDFMPYPVWQKTHEEVSYRIRELQRADKALRYWRERYGL